MLIASLVTSLLLAIVFNGLMAGIFFAFSVAVMPGLDDTDVDAAKSAMRAMNRRILHPVFFVVFFGAPVLSVICAALSVMEGRWDVAAWCAGAATGYLAGAFLPTVVVNVPLNDALEDSDVSWADYSTRWTRWNTFRSVMSAIATLSLAVAGVMWSAA